MTGYRSRHLRHECTSDGCFIEALPDWEDIIACFPRNIRPTDIDGMVEIGGSFLFLEQKRLGAGPDEGQRRALKALSRNDRTTVVFIRPGTEFHYQILVFRDGAATTNGWRDVTAADLKQWISAWAERADAASRAPASAQSLELSREGEPA